MFISVYNCSEWLVSIAQFLLNMIFIQHQNIRLTWASAACGRKGTTCHGLGPPVSDKPWHNVLTAQSLVTLLRIVAFH